MPSENHRRSSRPPLTSIIRDFAGLALIVVLILGLDQASKFLVVTNLEPSESWAPIPALSRILKVTYIFNSGAAFGLFQNSSNIFIVIAFLVAIGIVVYYGVGIFVYHSFLVPGFWIIRLSLGLQLGGALGNMIDRLRFQEGVVDFVDIGFWPIFNVADVSIVAGVVLLAYTLWTEEPEDASPPENISSTMAEAD